MKKILIALTTITVLVPLAKVAEARHNDYYRSRSVQAIAHDLQEATRHFHQAVEQRYSARHYREARALRDFHSLEDRARHFHGEAERYRRDPWHTLKDYEKLADAYNRAFRNLRYLHASDHLYRDFRRVESPMRELDSFFRRASYQSHSGVRYRGSYRDRVRGHGQYGKDYGVRIQLPRIEIQWDWRH